MIKNLLCAAAVAMLSLESRADNFSGSDDFNDNFKDLTKWGADVVQGSALLTETNQRMQYTASGSVASDFALRPWIASNGSSTAGWTIQMDVNLPTLPLIPGQVYEMGVGVRNGDDSTDDYGVVLELGNFGGSAERSFSAHQNLNGGEKSDVFTITTSTSATVRIRYDALTKTLFGEADANGAVGGYSFTTFDSQNIAAWNMTAASVFTCFAAADSSGNKVIASTDNVAGDNFAVAAVPEPSTCLLLLSGIGIAALKRRRRIPCI